ncbi:hypothetical protein RSOLAG1IB_01145 [Rhizoctonia solani AG-1 IB]|uniref:Uncharacterized protein n=1 Tax=Thanatephorus cucumeris (strain AG1-IB / isolate 7/3/14) TaxID=1108050 RepID=M5BU20_THACB|nr:hypothetical protein BN14_04734 [Rhizoctonia solani AG-1 IB]CEL55137.1 hypothetical protein RSOLAG1IB_01145 [Rhizoctonia solani AG-1 IB]
MVDTPNEMRDDHENAPLQIGVPDSNPPTDSESGSESESDLSDSPTSSVFSDGPYVEDLAEPEPGEEPQYRGKRTPSAVQATTLPPPPPPEPQGEPHRTHRGSDLTVVQGRFDAINGGDYP